MAKKATLLKRAQKLKLDVTERSTVPEIQAALDAHAAAQRPADSPTPPAAPETTPPEAPEGDNGDEAGVTVEMTLGAPETPAFSLKQVLLTYNSINRSRRRWVQNRNLLRNHWKELFELLEKASGRDGGKAVVYDPNWHEVSDKGVVMGAVDRQADDVQVAVYEGEADARVAELEAALEDTKSQLQAALEAKEIAENGTVKKGDNESDEQA